MRRWSSLTIAWGSFPAVTEGCSRLQGLHQAVHHTRLVTFCREDRVACQSSTSCRTHSHTTRTYHAVLSGYNKPSMGVKGKAKTEQQKRKASGAEGKENQREQRVSLNAQTLRDGG